MRKQELQFVVPDPGSFDVGSRRAVISWLGESSALITLGDTIDPETNRLVHSLARRLKDLDLHGIIDIVPAYASLLVSFEPLFLPHPALLESLGKLGASLPTEHSEAQRRHTVPVKYGGDEGRDLVAVANAGGLSEEEAVARHKSTEYRVYMVGFLPGFAYMGKVAAPIAAPRLATPRLSVPAGSVGIAGEQTGIYPFSSPGGWNIVGRTNYPVWQTDSSQPATFSPGDTVRFVPTDELSAGSSPVAVHEPHGHSIAMEVDGFGGFITVQDCGRPGLGSIGVPTSGALDAHLLAKANLLVGNLPGAAALEMVAGGCDLLATRTLVIALAGADFGCLVEGRRVPPGVSWLVRSGQRITFRSAANSPRGNLAYLAVSGGIDVPVVLGSASTLLSARFGGYMGRALRNGDGLAVGKPSAPPSALAGKIGAQGAQLEVDYQAPVAIRFLPYYGPNSAGETAINAFEKGIWSLSAKSDRMGARLEQVSGQPLAAPGGELLSFGTVHGAIQLPPGGKPIILGPDRGTTGGYPLLGVVARADWPLLAQLRPGTTLSFSPITLPLALEALASI